MVKSGAYRIRPGKQFRLKDHDPADCGPYRDSAEVEGLLGQGIRKLASLQEKLYAQDRWGLLLIFQAMDAAGKDSTIKHVMSGLNPQGCHVVSFKTPSAEELDHDYLWRSNRALPERGRIGVFNRSYYEEVLVVRVHPEYLEGQKLPPELVTKKIWSERYEDINAMERYLGRNGYVIRKFFLNVSKEEQARRFLERLDEPAKNWKFSAADLEERQHWGEYQAAYEEMIAATSTASAPWYVVPADRKWFTRLVVADAIIEALEDLDLKFPELTGARRRELDELRAQIRKNGIDGARSAGSPTARPAARPAPRSAGKRSKKEKRG